MERTIRLYSERASRMCEYLKSAISKRITALYGGDISDRIYSDILFSPLPSSKLGLFITESRLILLSERLLDNDTETILSIALHEVAHAVSFFETGSAEHDVRFREICRALGATEGFEKAKIDIRGQESVLARIKKLEALSSSPFEAEAQTAMTKARELAIKHHIDERRDDEERIWEADFVIGGRISRKYKILARIVSLLTGVYVITVHLDGFDGLRCYGQKGDVEIAIYLWETLERTIDRKLREERARDARLYRGQVGTTSFYMGVLSSMEERYRRSENIEDSKAIVRMSEESGSLAKKLVFSHARISSTRARVRQNEAVYRKGQEFGSRIEIRKGVRRDSGHPLLLD